MVWNSVKRLFGQKSDPARGLDGADFALDLLRALGREGNVTLSPSSVRMALGMTLLAARGGTADDLATGLRLGGTPPEAFHAAQGARMAAWSDPGRPYALVVTNAVFAAEALGQAPGAADRLRGIYRAPLRSLDFARDPGGAAREINRWVNESTRGVVPEIAGPGVIHAGTRLVIANAVYFKAEWRTKFVRDATHAAPFDLPSGERATVSMMQQTAQHRVWVGPEAEILEMAYRGDEVAMVFVLPPRGTALSDFESRLRGEALTDWLSHLVEERVRVTLPRFTIDTGALSLREPLEFMGVRAPFDPAIADFGGLFADPLVIDQILHRARIDVDEEGTVAAAATAVFATLSADRRKVLLFMIDRPFLFFLRDLRDGSVLFCGRVTDPR